MSSETEYKPNISEFVRNNVEHTVNETVWILISGMLGADGVRATGDASFCSIISEKDVISITIIFFKNIAQTKWMWWRRLVLKIANVYGIFLLRMLCV